MELKKRSEMVFTLSENQYVATIIPLTRDVGRFVPRVRTLRITFLVSEIIYEIKEKYLQSFWTRDAN